MIRTLILGAVLGVFVWAASAFELGESAYANYEYDAAIAHFTKAIGENPKHALAYSERANVYSDMGDNAAAIADFTKAIELDPKNANAYNNRAISYGQSGDLKNAEKDARKACDLKLCAALNFMIENGFISK